MLQSSGSLNVKDTSTDEFLGVFILMVRRGMERTSLAGFLGLVTIQKYIFFRYPPKRYVYCLYPHLILA